MNFAAIIDVSSIIWDPMDYENNTYHYSLLIKGISQLIDKFEKEKPLILIKAELLNEMINAFPFDKIPAGKLWAYVANVYSFLSNIPSSQRIDYRSDNYNVISVPVVIKPYFNDLTKKELEYLLTFIHIKGVASSVYFTFRHLWLGGDKLKTTLEENELEHERIVSDENRNLDNFFQKFKRIFEHSDERHHAGREQGDYVSPLSCYKGDDESQNSTQKYLDEAMLDGRRYYNLDLDNDVYVVFALTRENIYHGYDEIDVNKIPSKVRKRYGK